MVLKCSVRKCILNCATGDYLFCSRCRDDWRQLMDNVGNGYYLESHKFPDSEYLQMMYDRFIVGNV